MDEPSVVDQQFCVNCETDVHPKIKYIDEEKYCLNCSANKANRAYYSSIKDEKEALLMTAARLKNLWENSPHWKHLTNSSYVPHMFP